MNTDNSSILNRLYNLCEHGFDQVAVEVALLHLESELRSGRFDVVDAFLWQTDTQRLSSSVLVSILNITMTARGNLFQRSHFLEKATQKMKQELGEERALKLLETRK